MIVTGDRTAILLISLGLGYIVCYLSAKTTRGLRLVGLGIGTFIITLSMFFVFTNIINGTTRFYNEGRPMPHRVMMR